MNIYAQILVDEAEKRGITAKVLDEEANLYLLAYDGKEVVCRESLTDHTSAIAVALCDDKSLTRRCLQRAGLRVPRQNSFTLSPDDVREQTAGWNGALRCLRDWERVVVKPCRGEQGRGITVDLSSEEELESGLLRAAQLSGDIVVEEFVEGHDVRVIVIDHRFVAAIERRPAFVVGNGRDTIRQLIELRNGELEACTGGESHIPVDQETERVIGKSGYGWEDVLPAGQTLQVYKTANYHTGGTITDVTDRIPHSLRRVAERASQALDIPVVGLDFLLPELHGEDYVIIEANERPGLANHEPQPTAERFIDFLFPETRSNYEK